MQWCNVHVIFNGFQWCFAIAYLKTTQTELNQIKMMNAMIHTNTYQQQICVIQQ